MASETPTDAFPAGSADGATSSDNADQKNNAFILWGENRRSDSPDDLNENNANSPDKRDPRANASPRHGNVTNNANNKNSNADSKSSPYAVADSPEVKDVKNTLNRIVENSSVKAVMVLDPSSKLIHVQYPDTGISDFDCRHMKLEEFKLLVAAADDFIRDINPRSLVKTMRIRGRHNALVMEFEDDKNVVVAVQRSKFTPLISKNHI